MDRKEQFPPKNSREKVAFSLKSFPFKRGEGVASRSVFSAKGITRSLAKSVHFLSRAILPKENEAFFIKEISWQAYFRIPVVFSKSAFLCTKAFEIDYETRERYHFKIETEKKIRDLKTDSTLFLRETNAVSLSHSTDMVLFVYPFPVWTPKMRLIPSAFERKAVGEAKKTIPCLVDFQEYSIFSKLFTQKSFFFTPANRLMISEKFSRENKFPDLEPNFKLIIDGKKCEIVLTTGFFPGSQKTWDYFTRKNFEKKLPFAEIFHETFSLEKTIEIKKGNYSACISQMANLERERSLGVLKDKPKKHLVQENFRSRFISRKFQKIPFSGRFSGLSNYFSAFPGLLPNPKICPERCCISSILGKENFWSPVSSHANYLLKSRLLFPLYKFRSLRTIRLSGNFLKARIPFGSSRLEHRLLLNFFLNEIKVSSSDYRRISLRPSFSNLYRDLFYCNLAAIDLHPVLGIFKFFLQIALRSESYEIPNLDIRFLGKEKKTEKIYRLNEREIKRTGIPYSKPGKGDFKIFSLKRIRGGFSNSLPDIPFSLPIRLRVRHLFLLSKRGSPGILKPLGFENCFSAKENSFRARPRSILSTRLKPLKIYLFSFSNRENFSSPSLSPPSHLNLKVILFSMPSKKLAACSRKGSGIFSQAKTFFFPRKIFCSISKNLEFRQKTAREIALSDPPKEAGKLTFFKIPEFFPLLSFPKFENFEKHLLEFFGGFSTRNIVYPIDRILLRAQEFKVVAEKKAFLFPKRKFLPLSSKPFLNISKVLRRRSPYSLRFPKKWFHPYTPPALLAVAVYNFHSPAKFFEAVKLSTQQLKKKTGDLENFPRQIFPFAVKLFEVGIEKRLSDWKGIPVYKAPGQELTERHAEKDFGLFETGLFDSHRHLLLDLLEENTLNERLTLAKRKNFKLVVSMFSKAYKRDFRASFRKTSFSSSIVSRSIDLTNGKFYFFEMEYQLESRLFQGPPIDEALEIPIAIQNFQSNRFLGRFKALRFPWKPENFALLLERSYCFFEMQDNIENKSEYFLTEYNYLEISFSRGLKLRFDFLDPSTRKKIFLFKPSYSWGQRDVLPKMPSPVCVREKKAKLFPMLMRRQTEKISENSEKRLKFQGFRFAAAISGNFGNKKTCTLKLPVFRFPLYPAFFPRFPETCPGRISELQRGFLETILFEKIRTSEGKIFSCKEIPSWKAILPNPELPPFRKLEFKQICLFTNSVREKEILAIPRIKPEKIAGFQGKSFYFSLDLWGFGFSRFSFPEIGRFGQPGFGRQRKFRVQCLNSFSVFELDFSFDTSLEVSKSGFFLGNPNFPNYEFNFFEWVSREKNSFKFFVPDILEIGELTKPDPGKIFEKSDEESPITE